MSGPGTQAVVSLNEVKAFLRLDGPEEDALLAGLVRTATGLAEQFTGQVLLRGERVAQVAADGAWHRIGPTPMQHVVSAAGIDAAGGEVALSMAAVEAQIDFCGDGWVRVDPREGAVRAVLTVEAGLAGDWNGLPDALRQGVVRLVAHMFTHRDAADDGAPPAAIAALWRPWRRMRLS
ncbi:head-tail connector protein [Pacificimonas sp. ICDLI1SI03]